MEMNPREMFTEVTTYRVLLRNFLISTNENVHTLLEDYIRCNSNALRCIYNINECRLEIKMPKTIYATSEYQRCYMYYSMILNGLSQFINCPSIVIAFNEYLNSKSENEKIILSNAYAGLMKLDPGLLLSMVDVFTLNKNLIFIQF